MKLRAGLFAVALVRSPAHRLTEDLDDEDSVGGLLDLEVDAFGGVITHQVTHQHSLRERLSKGSVTRGSVVRDMTESNETLQDAEALSAQRHTEDVAASESTSSFEVPVAHKALFDHIHMRTCSLRKLKIFEGLLGECDASDDAHVKARRLAAFDGMLRRCKVHSSLKALGAPLIVAQEDLLHLERGPGETPPEMDGNATLKLKAATDGDDDPDADTDDPWEDWEEVSTEDEEYAEATPTAAPTAAPRRWNVVDKFKGKFVVYCDKNRILPLDLPEPCVFEGDFLSCMRSVTPVSWLAQKWELERTMQARVGSLLKPVWEAKHLILALALKEYGFDPDGIRSICSKESSTLERDRQCVRIRAIPDFVVGLHRQSPSHDQISKAVAVINHDYPQALTGKDWIVGHRVDKQGKRFPVMQGPLGKTYFIDEEGRQMGISSHVREGLVAGAAEDHDLAFSLQKVLSKWVRRQASFAERVELFGKSRKDTFKTRCSSVQANNRQLLEKYNDIVPGFGFSVDSAMKDCQRLSRQAQSVMDRLLTEVTSGCDRVLKCSVKSQTGGCPEGFACDKRRCQRKGIMMFVGSGMGGFLGGAGFPVLFGAIAGMVLAGPAGAAGGAAAAMAAPGKVPLGLLGATLGKTEVVPRCMCFPMLCQWDDMYDRCVVTPTRFQNRSDPGVARLPYTGMKCARTASRSRPECGFVPCEAGDTMARGPTTESGEQLFGRVGLGSDGTVYNCANTEGTSETLLTLLPELPDPVGEETVGNTVESRRALLQLYADRWEA